MALLRDRDRAYATPEDICTHLGEDYETYFGAASPPIYQTTLFTKAGDGQPFAYTRCSNPTTEIAERKIAALEGADGALCFSSGMAAITAAIMHFIRKDCHVISVASAYPGTRDFFANYLPNRMGVSVTFVPGDRFEDFERAARPETRLILLESPSSAAFKLQDIERVATFARQRSIATVMDNSYSSPIFQNPLKWGVDIVCHTASKYLCGHSCVVAGALCARRDIIEQIQSEERMLYGAVLGPQESWLLVMGLRTLPERMRAHFQSGLRIARFLEAHPRAERVYYPALESNPQADLYKKYMTGAGGLMSFVPKGTPEQARAFVDALRVFRQGVSWGGYESLVLPRSVGMTEEQCAPKDLPAGLVRLAVGLESPDTLERDLDQAFRAMG